MTLAELRGLLTGFALLWLGLLVLACLDTRISAFGVLEALRFHLTVAGILLIPLLFMTGARWRAALAAVIVGATLGQAGWLILEQQQRRWAHGEAVAGTPSLSVISFNVLANSEQGQNVVDYLSQNPVDVVAIQETPGILLARERLAQTYPYHIGCAVEATCDLSLWSRLPLINPQLYPFGPSGRERLISAAVERDGQVISLVALHLSKPYADGSSTAELWQVSHLIEAVSGPLLIMGDFNVPAWTSEAARFARRNDLVPPPTYPGTWPERLGDLGLPIDNMFSRGGLVIDGIAALPDNFGSNHRGLVATATLRPPLP